VTHRCGRRGECEKLEESDSKVTREHEGIERDSPQLR
jgi:hypothetical protein